MAQVARRRFLLFLAGTGAATFGWFRRPGGQHEPPLVSRTARALGADVTLTVLHRDEQAAQRAIDAAFAELETVEAVMSLYRPASQLARLNKTGSLAAPHPDLVDVLRAAEEMSRRSGGAFDVTVQPLWSLFRQSQQEGRLPRDGEIERAMQLVDWRRVEVTPSQVRLLGEPRGAITLNGIAQGFAADRVAATLRAHGVQDALIDTGEVSGLGVRPGSDAWRVGIQHPRHDAAFVAVAKLAGRCLATSGDYATKFSDDFRWHHLFDPRTGRSPTELMSVSIAARTALEADALSTAAFVLGAEAGANLVRETQGADAFFVLRDGRTRATPGFPFDAA